MKITMTSRLICIVIEPILFFMGFNAHFLRKRVIKKENKKQIAAVKVNMKTAENHHLSETFLCRIRQFSFAVVTLSPSLQVHFIIDLKS